MEKIMKLVKETKFLGLVGNILLSIAVFLPIISVSVSLFGFSHSKSVSYINGDGVIVLILAIINIILIFANKLSEKIPFLSKLTNPKLTLIPTAIVAILLIALTSNSSKLLGSEYSSLATIKFNIGFYLLWLGTLASAAYPFLYKDVSSSSINSSNE